VPEVTCQKALKAFPPEFAPKFRGFKLQGKFMTDVAIDINWADLDALELGGKVGIYGCKVLEAPKSVDTERLLEEFEQEVELEKDKYLKFMVGPSNPDFVPIADVSPYLINSFLTTEDGLFYKHKGFIVSEFRTAIVKNLKAGYFKYGASSITMQFVKNVMLHRQKTAARKLQELFLTWYVEQTLEKDRIMEIYLNVIEFGPGLYGIGPAARHYFGKSAKDITPLEAAFFSTILPGPKKRHMQYCEGKLRKWTEAKIQRILKLAYEKERLTELEYLTASTTTFAFVYPPDFDEKACKKMTEKAIKNSRKTMPEPDDEPEEE
jgi:membrane peptidoglycan carboxypeptidase